MTEIFRPPFFQPDSINGVPLAGALLYFYVAGTTTPITVYQDSGLITPHQSPVVADASGIFPAIYVNTTTYKIVLQTSAGVTVKTYDNINTTNAGSTVLDSTFVIQNASDITKQVQFSVSSITTGTTRTFTFPDSNGTLLTTGSTATLAQAAAATSSSVVLAPNALVQERGFSNAPFINLSLVASVGSSALTVALKGQDGNDPSATNPVYVSFRSATLTSGANSQIAITAATSIVISSGSTMGFTSTVIGKLWLVGFNDAGTFRLGLVNALSGTSIMALVDGIYSSTAEGGSGGADSAQVIYTGTAATSKAMTVLGYLEATEATAGTWATAPSYVQIRTPSTRLPGDVIQTVISTTGTVASGTTTIPADNTIPQNTEGDQYFSQAITPVSGANLLEIDNTAVWSTSAATVAGVALFRDSGANAIASSLFSPQTGNASDVMRVYLRQLAGSVSSTTYKIRAGAPSATLVLNGQPGPTQYYGGTLASFLKVSEIVA